jgi:PAS domain S-box-containing protein
MLLAISESNQAMMRARDETELMQLVCRIIVKNCGHSLVWIGIAEQDKARTVKPAAYSGFEAGYLENLRITWADSACGRGPTGVAIRTGKPSVCRNMHTDPCFRPWRAEALKRGYASSIAVPFQVDGRVAGAIMIYATQPEVFSEEETALISQLAADLGYGIQSLRLNAARNELLRQVEDQQRMTQQLADEMNAVFGAMSEAVLVCEPTGRIRRANAAAVRLLGFEPQAVTMADIAARLRIESADGEVLNDWTRLPTARALNGETVLAETLQMERRPSGEKIWILASAAPLREPDGKIFGAVTTLTDIRERKETENRLAQVQRELEIQVRERTRELEEANEYNRSLIEASLDPLMTITPNGKIGDANPAAEAVTGYARTDLIGRDFSSLFTDEELVRAACRRVFEEGRVSDIELEIRHRDGRITPVLYNAAVITDETHAAKWAIAAARDITRRRQAETQARTNLRRVEVTADISHQLVETGPDYRAVLPGIAKSLAEFLGGECRIHLPTEDGRLHAAAGHRTLPDAPGLFKERPVGVPDELLQKAYQTRQPVFLPSGLGNSVRANRRPQAKTSSEGDTPSSVLVMPLAVPDAAFGVLSAARYAPCKPFTTADFTLLQEVADRLALAITNANLYSDLKNALAEEHRIHRELVQTEKLAAMGRMLGSVAHELNNPLQTIKNCLYLVRQDAPAESRILEYLDMASSETNRLVHLVAQLRELYRPKSEKAMPPEDLGAILRDVHALMTPQLENSHVEWKEIAGPQGCMVLADRERIQQVFINLAANAIEAMQPNGGILSVGLTLSADSLQVGAQFRDTGPGVPQDLIHNLFDPFITTKPSGLGLGLSICYEIAQKHGGSIGVENPPEGGALFTLWLPRRKEEQNVTPIGEQSP